MILGAVLSILGIKLSIDTAQKVAEKTKENNETVFDKTNEDEYIDTNFSSPVLESESDHQEFQEEPSFCDKAVDFFQMLVVLQLKRLTGVMALAIF